MCEGQTECLIRPTTDMFDAPVTCKCGWVREMWITYSCDGGRHSYEGGRTRLITYGIGALGRTASKINPFCLFG